MSEGQIIMIPLAILAGAIAHPVNLAARAILRGIDNALDVAFPGNDPGDPWKPVPLATIHDVTGIPWPHAVYILDAARHLQDDAIEATLTEWADA